MSGLISPGVIVTITDEGSYGTTGAGTIPLIFIATQANKESPTSTTSVAPYTTSALVNTLFLATSQRELIQNYGNPIFNSYQGSIIQGDETSEYGLHAAYSYLGISNRAYILRADIDLAQLLPSVSAPSGPPLAGTYWLDLSSTSWGLFLSNGSSLAGNAWISQNVSVVPITQIDQYYVPLSTYGSSGNFAVVPWTSYNLFYQNIGGNWYQIGSSAWFTKQPTTITGSSTNPTVTAGNTFTINGSTVTIASPGDLNSVVTVITNANIPNITASVLGNRLVLNNTVGGSITITNGTGTALTSLGITAGIVNGVSFSLSNSASWPANSVAGSVWLKGNPANKGAQWVIKYYNGTTAAWSTLTSPFYPFDSTKVDNDLTKDTAARTALGTPTVGTVYVGFDPNVGVQQIRYFSGTFWEPLNYEADIVSPTTSPVAGTLWYDAVPKIDIMYGDGEQWLGYRRKYPLTDPNGVQISGSAPTTQSTGAPLVENDLWLDSSDLENYPLIYTWDATGQTWDLIDNTDHTSPFGIVFSDARANSGPNFTGIANAGQYAYNSTDPTDLSLSDYVDPDVLLPETYPAGMLLFNTRYSTGNVKVWYPNYFLAGAEPSSFDANTNFTINGYNSVTSKPGVSFPPVASAGRWVDASGLTATDNSPYMMRKAQRIMVVKAFKKIIESDQDIRSELIYFNLIACPGYIEVLGDLETLNVDNSEVAFVLADAPIRLQPNGTAVSNWAGNQKNVASNGEDGLTTSYSYSAVHYPWGLGTDLSGNEVMIPPSTIALRTFGYNDQVAYQWFAPAGFTRGLVSNATSVGYLASDGTYQPVILNQGQRDVLYSNKINPIAYIQNRGLVVYGQKTLASVAGALDRINVARLANYIKYNLDIICKPYLFEPNDSTTQKAAKHTVEIFLSSLVGLRGLYDYAVVCDATNNTPDRIDLYELWIDVAIQPEKAIEWVIVPVRIQNTSSSPTVV